MRTARSFSSSGYRFWEPSPRGIAPSSLPRYGASKIPRPVQHAPAAHSVSTAIEQLSVEDLRTFREILERDVEDFEDWGVVESYLGG
jgi:hypothetical protein